jgi:hypothetical protein
MKRTSTRPLWMFVAAQATTENGLAIVAGHFCLCNGDNSGKESLRLGVAFVTNGPSCATPTRGFRA